MLLTSDRTEDPNKNFVKLPPVEYLEHLLPVWLFLLHPEWTIPPSGDWQASKLRTFEKALYDNPVWTIPPSGALASLKIKILRKLL